MNNNLIPPFLILLIYLPIIINSLISKRWKEKFMKVHSKSFNEYLIEISVGILYAIIIILSSYSYLDSNRYFFFVGLVIYFFALYITYHGYYSFYISKNNSLVKDFPYNYSRNPTYFFGFLAIFGLILMINSYYLFIFLTLLFVLTHKIILEEEKFCEKKYKKAFFSYKKLVRRYF